MAAENGRVLFSGDERSAHGQTLFYAAANAFYCNFDFEALSFDDLFESVKDTQEDYIGSVTPFPLRYSLRSKLHSVPDCQRIVKKAVVERLKSVYHTDWFQEEGPKHQIQFSLLNNRCEVFLDTTGAPLYKRGYKLEQNEASIRETLAASIVKITRWRGRGFYRPLLR